MLPRDFSIAMATLAAVYDRPRDDAWLLVKDLYWHLFGEWDSADFHHAISTHLRTSRFFPKPCDLLPLKPRHVTPAQLSLDDQDDHGPPPEWHALLKSLGAHVSMPATRRRPPS